MTDAAAAPGSQESAGLQAGVSRHPLAIALTAAADGRFPPVDGSWERVPPWRPGVVAVVAFTGHAFLAVPPEWDLADRLGGLEPDGFGGAHHPRVAVALAGPDGWIDSLDAVLVTRGLGGPPALVDRPDLLDHPRAAFAHGVRDHVRCVGREAGDALVTVGRGLGGLVELGVEAVDPGVDGAELLREALTLVAPDEVVVAAVAPGNARALRTFLAAGFRPVASVQLIKPT
jgi:hypothetical protein